MLLQTMKFAKKYGTKPVKINHLYKKNKTTKITNSLKQATETTIEAMLYKYYLANKQLISVAAIYTISKTKSCNFISFTSAISHKLYNSSGRWRHRWHASLRARAGSQCWLEKSDGATVYYRRSFHHRVKRSRTSKQTKNSQSVSSGFPEISSE